FTRSQLQYIKELGTSRFGKVIVLQGEGSDIQPGKKKLKVVVMMCHDDMSLKDKFIFLHEASAFKLLDSRNVLKLYCQCVESSPYLTILESCSLGDLKSYMRGQKLNIEKMLDGDVILGMICDVVAGLQAIHNINFVHRDLSMRSCLITNDLTVKIGDYGLNEYNDGVGIPIRWMAPESLSFSDGLRVNDITKKSNIWSFGVLMWELLRCGDLPYPGLSDQHVLRLVVMEKEVKLSRPLLLNDNVPYLLVDFLLLPSITQ
ncbi:hypothetical protein HELRODRAFT_82586, partial [Helobdella robusta]|uniref:Protein kinase domain-containing protein n=1 Tax=Helobdella robusta TaxID=6412 RepID=T1G4U1_HELRO